MSVSARFSPSNFASDRAEMLGRAAALLTAGPLPAALLTAVRPGRSALVRAVHVESRLTELGITLPPPGGPKANYQTACFESPTLLYVSGHLPVKLDGSMVTGSLGPGGLSLDEGVEAARWCGLNLISTISDRLGGDLDRVEQVVKLFGIVNSKQDFTEQHLVLNGASDLMMEVFGDRGSNPNPNPNPNPHPDPNPNGGLRRSGVPRALRHRHPHAHPNPSPSPNPNPSPSPVAPNPNPRPHPNASPHPHASLSPCPNQAPTRFRSASLWRWRLSSRCARCEAVMTGEYRFRSGDRSEAGDRRAMAQEAVMTGEKGARQM